MTRSFDDQKWFIARRNRQEMVQLFQCLLFKYRARDGFWTHVDDPEIKVNVFWKILRLGIVFGPFRAGKSVLHFCVCHPKVPRQSLRDDVIPA